MNKIHDPKGRWLEITGLVDKRPRLQLRVAGFDDAVLREWASLMLVAIDERRLHFFDSLLPPGFAVIERMSLDQKAIVRHAVAEADGRDWVTLDACRRGPFTKLVRVGGRSAPQWIHHLERVRGLHCFADWEREIEREMQSCGEGARHEVAAHYVSLRMRAIKLQDAL